MLKIKQGHLEVKCSQGAKNMIVILNNKKNIFMLFALIMVNKKIISMDKSKNLLLEGLATIPSTEAPRLAKVDTDSRKKLKNKKKRLKKFLERLYSNENKGITTTTSDDEPGLTFDEEDIHPYAFDQARIIRDYQAYVDNLKSLLAKKNILEYCNQLNRLANQIAELEPKQQLEKYFMLLFNNLDAETELINYFSIAITQIYSNYIKKYDKKKLFKTLISDHFTTFVLPLTQEETQKKLAVTLQQFLALEPSQTIDEIFEYKTNDMRSTDSSAIKTSLPQDELSIWQNPIRVTMPHNTTCYSLHKEKDVISATRDGKIFHTDLNKKKHRLLNPNNNPKVSNIPYYILPKKMKNKEANSAHIKVLKAKQNLTPSSFLNAYHCYFLGKKSGKIIVQNDSAKIIKKLLGHKKAISGLVPLRDNNFKNLLASSSYDGTMKIWHYATETCLQTLKSSIGEIEALAQASPELLIGLSKNRFLEIWDVQNKRSSKNIKLIEIIYSPVVSIVGYNNYCLTGLSNGTILIWDPIKSHCLEEIEIEGQSPITQLSSDNSHVIATQEINNKKILTFFMKKTNKSNKDL